VSLLHRCYKTAFRAANRVGLHVVKNHFYSPTPDLDSIPASYWNEKSALVGVKIDVSGQLEMLRRISAFRTEYSTLPLTNSFGRVDVEVLFSMVRMFNPSKVIEIGSGHSTTIIRKAKRPDCELVCIEPYARIPGDGFGLIRQPVQSVPLDLFADLGENDVLFIDSSHVLKEASDVLYEFGEILPRLRKGVLVHVHDVLLPYHYPKVWVADDLRFWNEQYLLQAFLAFNSAFDILWAGSWMATYHPDELRAAISSFTPETRPGSFWMRKIE